MVFCFALVLIQQHQTSNHATTKQVKDAAHSKLSASSLQAIDQLQPIVVAPPSSATAKTANPNVSAPAQPSKTSGSAVQAAAPSSQPAGSIVYTVTQPVTKTLDNLLP